MARLDKKRFVWCILVWCIWIIWIRGHCHIASAVRSDSMAAGDMNLVNIHSEGIRLAHIRLAAQNQPVSSLWFFPINDHH